MGKVLAIANQKGGVGKTTTSVNLAAGLGKLGKKVLLIDFDPQGNATSGIGVDRDNIKAGMQKVLTGEATMKEAIKESSAENVEVVPATIDLAGADILIPDSDDKKQILKNCINEVKGDYDFVIIDCPPSLGFLNTSALTAADEVLITIQAQHYALEGIKQLFSTIQLIQRLYNKDLGIAGILVTMFDVRTNLSADVKKLVDQTFKERAYNVFISQNTKLAECPMYGKSIFDYDANSKGAQQYLELAKEVIAHG